MAPERGKQRSSIFRRIGEGISNRLPGSEERRYQRTVRKVFVEDYQTLGRLRHEAKTPYQRARIEAILHSSGCTGKRLFLAGEMETDPHPDEEVIYDPKFPFPPDGTEETFTNVIQFPGTPGQS